MSDKDLVFRGDVKAFKQSFIYDGGYPYVKLVSAVTIEDIDSIQPVPHEMTAKEFAKAFRRMCDSYDVNGRNNCEGCELWRENICCLCDLPDIIPIVEAWAREHPEERSE